MKKLYLIGNAHIDPVWLWRWQDGYSEVLATFRSALDRMKEEPDFKFTAACAVYYQWVEESDPAMFEEIRARVREGRWCIVGGWLLQPDCNIPTGESFARHTLLSQRYFKEKFGLTAKTGYNVDSFGHNASLPKILRAGRMESYVYMRPDPSEKEQAFDLFTWKGDDGSAVTAYRIPISYAINEATIERLDRIADTVTRDGAPRMAFYGVGNHGGGPSARLIDAIKERAYPNAVFSTPDEYFADMNKDALPVVAEELQHHARGCYSATSVIKAMNRRAEENLLAAERFCLLANKLVSFSYPKETLTHAWKNLLFNQFHDILAGCAIESAYTDASYLFGEIMSITDREINRALQAIACKIDTGADSPTGIKRPEGMGHWLVWEHETLGTPLVIFNPHAFPVHTVVSMRIHATRLTDERGNAIPFQLTRGEQTNVQRDVYVVTFPVELPALGYRVYRAFQDEVPAKKHPSVYADAHTLENTRLRVEFDPTTGELSRILDKQTETELLNSATRTILTDETACDTWAHREQDLGKICDVLVNAECTVVEMGEVCATLRVIQRSADATVTRFYTLDADSDELFVKGEAELSRMHRALKIAFPARDRVICEIPYGTVERPLSNGEEPFGKWFASAGLCVANDSKHGYDSTEREIRMTLLRSAIYADHYGFEGRDDRCVQMDRGPQPFSYSIFPYRTVSDAHRRAALLNFPVRTLNTSFHHGPLPELFEGFSMNAENVRVTAIKMAEDGDSAILRLSEDEGKETNARMTLVGTPITASVSPHAIRTVREDGTLLDLIEWEVQS